MKTAEITSFHSTMTLSSRGNEWASTFRSCRATRSSSRNKSMRKLFEKGIGKLLRLAWVILLAGGGVAHAQLSSSAYRVLGQVDFRQNGLNMVEGVELYTPSSIAVDLRDGETHIYIADTGNSRVLAWRSVNAFHIGDAPSLVLGQPGPQYSAPLGIGTKGFKGLSGITVDPATGNLYVADTANNRLLRFAAPLSNPNRVEPDAVYGRPGFSTAGAS